MSATSPARQLIDVNTFIGPYPFRHVPHPDADALVRVMDREQIARAVVGYLPAAWHRSTADANRELFRLIAPFADRLSPAPVINPGWPDWEHEFQGVVDAGAAAIRIYPPQWGFSASGDGLADLAARCAESRTTAILTTRFEDARQRHWMDSASEVSAATVRALARSHEAVRVVLTCAGRGLIEEIHWSLTPAEQERVWYDISWIWGPPQGDLAHLLRTMGPDRFLFGSMWPLRLVQTPFAGLDLLPNELRGRELARVATAIPRL